jgi:hypothetical protein
MHIINGTKSVVNYSDGVFFSELYVSSLWKHFLEIGVNKIQNEEQMVLNLILGGSDYVKNLAGENVRFLAR